LSDNACLVGYRATSRLINRTKLWLWSIVGKAQTAALDSMCVYRHSAFARYRFKARLNRRPIALGELGNVEVRSNNVQGDSFVFSGRDRTRCETDVRDHERLVGGDLLADMLKQHDIGLTHPSGPSPFRICDIQVQSHLIAALPVEINLMLVFSKTRPSGIRDLPCPDFVWRQSDLLRNKVAAELFVLFAVHRFPP